MAARKASRRPTRWTPGQVNTGDSEDAGSVVRKDRSGTVLAEMEEGRVDATDVTNTADVAHHGVETTAASAMASPGRVSIGSRWTSQPPIGPN